MFEMLVLMNQLLIANCYLLIFLAPDLTSYLTMPWRAD